VKNNRLYIILWTTFGLFVSLYITSSFLPVSKTALANGQSALYLVPVVLAAIASVLAYRRAEPAEKRFWLFLMLAMLMFLAQEIYWVSLTFLQGVAEPPHPSFSDVMQFGAYIVLFLLLVSMARFSRSLIALKARFLIDTLIAVLFVATVVTTLFIRPLIGTGELSVLSDKAFNIIYPVFDIGLLFGISACVFGFKLSRWRPWETLVAIGLAFMALADIVFTLLSLRGLYESNTFVAAGTDSIWLFMYFCVFMACVVRLRTPVLADAPRTFNETERATSRAQEIAIYVLIMATMPTFILLSFNQYPYDRWFLAFFGTVLGVLIVSRAVLVASEHNRLFVHSVTDSVTGAYNYRFFQQRLEIELERAARYNETLSLAIVDLDNFAQVNSIYGHHIGDRVLSIVAQVAKNNVRLPDSICRIGGDEFALIMPQTNSIDAWRLCLRLQREVLTVEERADLEIKFTCGIATFPMHGRNKEELEKRADAAMYWAKFHGKNQVVVFDANRIDGLSPMERVKKSEELAYMKTVKALAVAVDARDSDTQFHSLNVSALAGRLAIEAGLDKNVINVVETAALLHDVGKIGISDIILKKPETLTEDDRRQVQEHPDLGCKILAATPFPEMLPWIAAHHEQWDGTGYPRGLQAEEIPREARIIAICDAYDAMTSDRPYHKAMSPEKAVEELKRTRSQQFDPELTDIFITRIASQEGANLAAGGQ
jgi:two-component system, cell cycle response regulator